MYSCNFNNLYWPACKIYNLHAGPHGRGLIGSTPHLTTILSVSDSSELTPSRHPTNSFFLSDPLDLVYKYFNKYLCVDLQVTIWLKEGHKWHKYMLLTHNQRLKRLEAMQTSGWSWTHSLSQGHKPPRTTGTQHIWLSKRLAVHNCTWGFCM
jgi:hypothetical protein